MPLREEWEAQGNWLFRWRSYLPFVLLILAMQAAIDFKYLHDRHTLQEIWMVCCLIVSLMGLMVRAHVVGHSPGGTSGRNTQRQIARSVNVTGWYSVVRHPLYLGNFLIWFGIALFFHHLWLTVTFCAIFWLYYERIMYAEEEFLRCKFGETYVLWASATPAFLPRFVGWQSPAMPFSWRKAMRREYTTAFGILMAFGALEFVEHLIVERRILLEPHWRVILPVAILLYGVLRLLKRRTDVLVKAS